MFEECENETIQEYAVRANKLIVFNAGRKREWESATDGGIKILNAWKKMTESSVQMPAFGVSIDSLTREEIKSGVWVEFVFEEEHMVAGMPFTRLLVQVQPEYRGFNVIRYWKGGYDGRCYYVDLRNGDMSDFFEEVCAVFAGD